jgi:hypothetical protein
MRYQDWDEAVRPWSKSTCLVADGSPQVEADNAAMARGGAGNRRAPYQGVAWEERGISDQRRYHLRGATGITAG